ncbi:MAG: formylglycine-generating enzyme family protein [Gammaproteobacteria bacterium]|nr:formylglycine-generating enzyme family protein [Gammaproteobacteria bacterium]
MAITASLAVVSSASANEAGKQPKTIRDQLINGASGPPLVLVPDGRFLMGSPQSEAGRYEDEGPQHKVRIKSFLLAQTPITVAQFKVFVVATDYETQAEKEQSVEWRNPATGDWEKNSNLNWRHNPRGEINGDDYPVVYVSWNDAQEYIKWLSKETGKSYRLPSESEMEYANRAGTGTTYWWGNDIPDQAVANLKGQFDLPENDKTWYPTASERQYAYAHGYTPFFFENYGDGYWGLSPVASFKANSFGLYDTTGNVWEWTADCWNGSYHGAPDDGSAWSSGACTYRVVRGGSYYCVPRHVRSANRWRLKQSYRVMYVGFRIARDVTDGDSI